MKKQGKIISIPVKEVTEGMQVLHENLIRKVYSIYNKGNTVVLDYGHTAEVKNLNTLVVEYEDAIQRKINASKNIPDYLQLPLKNSQWQKAIDNGEVDSDKEVEFEIIDMDYPNRLFTKIAKIIPQKAKNKMYSEEERNKFAIQFFDWYTAIATNPPLDKSERYLKAYLDSLRG